MLMGQCKCQLLPRLFGSKDAHSMCSGKVSLPLFEGKGLFVGSKEIELERSVSRGEYLSGMCFGHNLPSTTSTSSISPPTNQFKQPSFQLSHGKENSELSQSKTTDRATTEMGPQDITNYSLHWTANWCAFILDSRLYAQMLQEETSGSKEQDMGRGCIRLTHGQQAYHGYRGRENVSCRLCKSECMNIPFLRMGSVPWKGQALYAGFSTTISGKEVELDVAVSASQLPIMFGHEKNSADTPPISDTVLHIPEPQATKQFIPPTNFYASSKPRVKGPRCVTEIYLYPDSSHNTCDFADMTQIPLAHW
jgi:DNA repair and recombination protein RAD54B